MCGFREHEAQLAMPAARNPLRRAPAHLGLHVRVFAIFPAAA